MFASIHHVIYHISLFVIVAFNMTLLPCCTYCTMHAQLIKLNEKIELEVIKNTGVLIFAQFNTIFTSYELKLT